ncbi:MAG: SurA N-terminal domain-containing protein [Methylohalobius crimeensis]
MLQTIRDRAQGIFAWIILIIITVPFALWGIGNYFDTGKEKPIAVVGKREFFERDLIRLYEQQFAHLLGQSPYSEQELKRHALNQLIDNEVLFQQARDKDLAASDGQTAEFVRSLPFFQTDGRFDEEKYQRLLASQGLSSDQFIAQVRRSLLLQQIEQSVEASSFATEKEAQRFYRLQNQRRKIAYAILPLPEEKMTVDDAEAKAYYEQHQDRFQTPEQASVDYLALSIDAIARNIEPEEEDLRRYYEEQRTALTPVEQRRIRHILISVPPSASSDDKQKALTQAREIKQRLNQGEDFAALAGEFSEDPGSKTKGGDLGFVKPGELEGNFEEAAYSLSEGQISDPVETPFGYHLIQVTEIKAAKPKPFETVKEQIRQEFQRQQAESRFYELRERLARLAYENPGSLTPAAEALELEIQTTDRFTRSRGEGIAANPKIRTAAFSDEVLAGNNSEPVELDEGVVAVLRLHEHTPAQKRAFDAVRDQIIALLRQQKARQEVENQAKNWLAKFNQGIQLKTLAEQTQSEIQTADLVRDTPVPELREATRAIFQAPHPSKDQPVFTRVALADGRQALIQILSVEDGDYGSLEEGSKDKLKTNLARLFGRMTFQEYQLQERDKANPEINWPSTED